MPKEVTFVENITDSSPTTVEPFFYARVLDKKKIFIGSDTRVIKDRAFSECVMYDKDENMTTKEGVLEEIHIPYGIDLYSGATALIGVDYNYLKTSIPSKIQDRFTFFVYDPKVLIEGKPKYLFSISYPILATHIFSLSDYPKILRGEFDPTESKDGRIITTYNNFKFPSQTKSSVVNGWNESGSTYVADGLHKVKEKGKVIPFPVKNN
jgi:hypothetical protein